MATKSGITNSLLHTPAPSYLRWQLPLVAVLTVLLAVLCWLNIGKFDRDSVSYEMLTEAQNQEETLREEMSLLATELVKRKYQCLQASRDDSVPKITPKPDTRAEVPDHEQDHPGVLTIPDAVRRDRKLSFLEGCWRSITGLLDTRNNVPIEPMYCFTANGNGYIHIHGATGYSCKGGAKARFTKDNVLIIETLGKTPCDNQTVFYQSTIVCKQGEGGQAHCQGRNEDGTQYSVTIVRK